MSQHHHASGGVAAGVLLRVSMYVGCTSLQYLRWRIRLPRPLRWGKVVTMKHHSPTRFKKQHTKQRGTAAQRGYGHRWRVYRLTFLSANPLCAHCQRKAAVHVDHIKAVKGKDDPAFWESDNHQGLCHSCHSVKTAAEDGSWGRKKQTSTNGKDDCHGLETGLKSTLNTK